MYATGSLKCIYFLLLHMKPRLYQTGERANGMQPFHNNYTVLFSRINVILISIVMK